MKVHIVQSKSSGTIYGVFFTKEIAEHFLYNCEHPRISVTEHEVIGKRDLEPKGSGFEAFTELAGDIDFSIPIETGHEDKHTGDIFLTEEHRKAHEEHFKKKEEEP